MMFPVGALPTRLNGPPGAPVVGTEAVTNEGVLLTGWLLIGSLITPGLNQHLVACGQIYPEYNGTPGTMSARRLKLCYPPSGVPVTVRGWPGRPRGMPPAGRPRNRTPAMPR